MPSHLTPDDRPAAIRSAVLRVLHCALAAGEALPFVTVREEVRRLIRNASREEIWRALRELVDRGMVSAADVEEVRDFHGFEETLRFVVFSFVRRGEGHWWHRLVKASGREAADA